MTMTMAPPALVIVPTYNEALNITEVAGRLFATAGGAVELLIVDDGSPDGTADIVRSLGDHRIHLLERAGKQGLGTAYVAGFRWARERGYWGVVEMDADLSHDPGDVPRLLERLRSSAADLVIGSRYVEGGRVANWSLPRRALSRGGNVYARWLLRMPVRDATSGFRAYRGDTLASLDLADVASEGYAFQIEMTLRIHRLGGKIVELPIVFTDRTRGASKMGVKIAGEALVRVARWAVRPPH